MSNRRKPKNIPASRYHLKVVSMPSPTSGCQRRRRKKIERRERWAK